MENEPRTEQTGPTVRRWQRFHVTVPVRITVEGHRHLNVMHTRGCKMNNGGLTVQADAELTVGNLAEVKFTPPHFYPFVKLRGVIRNRDGDRYGVEFITTSAEEEKQLAVFRKILARWAVDASQGPDL